VQQTFHDHLSIIIARQEIRSASLACAKSKRRLYLDGNEGETNIRRRGPSRWARARARAREKERERERESWNSVKIFLHRWRLVAMRRFASRVSFVCNREHRLIRGAALHAN